MKKSITTLAIVSLLTLGAASAFAWGGGRGTCPGYGGGQGGGMGYGYHMNQQSGPEFEKYLNDTVELRARLAADHVKLRNQMHSANPDTKVIEQLTASITKGRVELAQKAREAGVEPGNGYGQRGQGHGYGQRGMGRW